MTNHEGNGIEMKRTRDLTEGAEFLDIPFDYLDSFYIELEPAGKIPVPLSTDRYSN
jgi:hypothetical protein